MEKILIGIQARSTSDRLPEKVFKLIGGKPLLQHVIDSCDRAIETANRYKRKRGLEVQLALLIPEGDKIRRHFRGSAKIIEGSELDVLSRYYDAACDLDADYIIRVTGDCPLLCSPIITKTINTIALNDHDYVSNVLPDVRGVQDGLDCEGFNFKILEAAHHESTLAEDREHVTTWMIREHLKNGRFDFGLIYPFIHNVDGVKLSVDTEDDLERVREVYDKTAKAVRLAGELYGKRAVYRF